MNIYYLMIKIHNITGLRYLCQTKKKDPYKYLGSGKDWCHHLKMYGRSVDTHIILETTDWDKLTAAGRYYSKLWHITTASDDFGNKIWANIIPESGGGTGNGKTFNRGNIPWNKGIQGLPQSPESVILRSKSNTGKKRTIEHKKNMTAGWENRFKSGKGTGREGLARNIKIYEFEFLSGTIEKCTQLELRTKYNLHQGNLRAVCKGLRKSVSGWQLKQTTNDKYIIQE
jgi:hypothetical protein